MTREEIIEGLKAVDKECGKHFNEGFAWMSQVINESIKALEQEPCEDVARGRFEDLCEYFGDAKDILNNRKDFKEWLDRIKWHVRKADELYRKYECKNEPCEDVISRQAAIDALGEEPPVWYDGEDEIAERRQWRWDVEAIKAVPPVSPARQAWIPVSERLPEDNAVVLVTYACGNVGTSSWHSSTNYNNGFDNVAHRIPEGVELKVENFINYGVVAWQPLPEPYKGESEEAK